MALDNLRRRGSEWNLSRLRDAGVAFVHGDVRIAADLALSDRTFDLVIDAAAEPSVQAAFSHGPGYVVETNLIGTVNLIERARRDGAAIVFLSTSRVYPMRALNALAYEETQSRFVLCKEQSARGASAEGITEAFSLDGVRSLYGATKLAAELLLEEYAAMFGLRCVVNRCGIITGPWQMGKVDQGVFALWMGRHYFGRPLTYVGYGGTGKQVRDLLHVDELCDLVIGQLGALDTLPHRTYNVGGGIGSSLSLLEATRLCEEITGNRVTIGSAPETHPSDVRIYVTDNTRVTADTGWRPRKSARETLVDIFAWIRANEAVAASLWS